MPPPPVYDTWDLKQPNLPPRSQLFALEPIGVGTSFVESLTGYVSRLAEAHTVSVGNLVGRALSAATSKLSGVSLNRQKVGLHGFYAQSHAVNGFGKLPKTWVDALEKATLQRNLRFLTLLPFEGVFSLDGVFRRGRAWCPECYEEWQSTGKVVYEPLLWTMELVTICPKHRRLLEDNCPYCHRALAALAVFSRPGYCSACAKWLGRSDSHPSSGEGIAGFPTAEAAFWHTKAMGDLLSVAAHSGPQCLRASFTANFQNCVEVVGDGSQLAFAKASRISYSTVVSQMMGQRLPQISTLLRICYHLDISPTAFLVNDHVSPVADWERAKRTVQRHSKCLSRQAAQVRLRLERAVPKSERGDVDRKFPELCRAIGWKTAPYTGSQLAAMKAALSNALHESPVPSLDELGKRLGHSTSEPLRDHFPNLCDQILERRRVIRNQRIADLRKRLRAMLSESPAPSLPTICNRVGLSSSTLWKYWSDGMTAIHLKRRHDRRKTSERRKERMIQEVRGIVQALHREGKCPTQVRVRALLSKTTLKDWKALEAAVRAARGQLRPQQ
jgi:transcriptional regulator with XRE-family HTH domain